MGISVRACPECGLKLTTSCFHLDRVAAIEMPVEQALGLVRDEIKRIEDDLEEHREQERAYEALLKESRSG